MRQNRINDVLSWQFTRVLVDVTFRLNVYFFEFSFLFFFDSWFSLQFHFLFFKFIKISRCVQACFSFACLSESDFLRVSLYMSVNSCVDFRDNCCFRDYRFFTFHFICLCYERPLYESRRRKPGWRFTAGPPFYSRQFRLTMSKILEKMKKQWESKENRSSALQLPRRNRLTVYYAF